MGNQPPTDCLQSEIERNPVEHGGIRKERAIILCVDDDDDDRVLVKAAFSQVELPLELHFAEDGQDLLDYLHRHGKYSDGAAASPRPDLILLDLNMPRKDGREALEEIKSDPELRTIPVVILTTSKESEDISRCYGLGVDSVISKPPTYDELKRIAAALSLYCMGAVTLPK